MRANKLQGKRATAGRVNRLGWAHLMSRLEQGSAASAIYMGAKLLKNRFESISEASREGDIIA